MSLCNAGLLWFLPCSAQADVIAIYGRRTRFDQPRKVPVCRSHGERIRGWGWIIRVPEVACA